MKALIAHPYPMPLLCPYCNKPKNVSSDMTRQAFVGVNVCEYCKKKFKVTEVKKEIPDWAKI